MAAPELPARIPLQVQHRTTDTSPMATHGRIILLVFVVLLAGCGQDNTVAATRATAKDAPTTAGPTTTLAPTTSTAAPTTTVTMAPTTTSATVQETTRTTIHHADQVLPGSFGTMSELYSLTNPGRLYPLNTEVVNSLGSCEGEDEVARQCPGAWEWGSMNISYLEDLTVWDIEGIRVAQRHGGPQMILHDDGTWYEIEDEAWSIYGFPLKREEAQLHAASCIEQGAEAVGLDTIAGVTTLHITCSIDVEGQEVAGYLDVWIGEQGHVMKSFFRAFPDPVSGLALLWEVTGLDVEPTGPLPPGW